jgi:hypothetical protein
VCSRISKGSSAIAIAIFGQAMRLADEAWRSLVCVAWAHMSSFKSAVSNRNRRTLCRHCSGKFERLLRRAREWRKFTAYLHACVAALEGQVMTVWSESVAALP